MRLIKSFYKNKIRTDINVERLSDIVHGEYPIIMLVRMKECVIMEKSNKVTEEN